MDESHAVDMVTGILKATPNANADLVHEAAEAIRAVDGVSHGVILRERVDVAWLRSRDPEDWAEYFNVYVVEETDGPNGVIKVSLEAHPIEGEWTITRLKSQTNIWRRAL